MLLLWLFGVQKCHAHNTPTTYLPHYLPRAVLKEGGTPLYQGSVFFIVLHSNVDFGSKVKELQGHSKQYRGGAKQLHCGWHLMLVERLPHGRDEHLGNRGC